MSGTAKESETAGKIRDDSPVHHPESPNHSVSTRLQEEYSELLRYAVGVPCTNGKPETAGQVFQPISKSGSSSARQTPIDHLQERSSPQTTQGHSGTGNLNGNSIYSVQQPKRNLVGTKGNRNTNKGVRDDSELEESSTVHTTTIMTSTHSSLLEPALADLSGKLDAWLGKLKSDILTEFSHMTIQTLENQKVSHQAEIQELMSERQRVEKELNRVNEMVNTCEQSMARKDTVIDNMNQALGKQRDKVTMAQAFYQTRVKYMEAKNERFTESLAKLHSDRRLVQKVLRSWYSLIQQKWKNRAEYDFERQAQDVCKQLSIDYEDKIRSMNEEIEDMNRKMRSMQDDKEQCLSQLKKAFMRGMCALNIETMTAFSQEGGQNSSPTEFEDNSNACNISNNLESNLPQKDDHQTKSVPADAMGSCGPDLHSGSGQVSSLSVVGTGPPQQSKLKSSKGKGRPSAAGAPSLHALKVWGHSQSLAPPMASVVVERHDPVTKQTVGKATAVRYPKHSTSKNMPSHTRHKHGQHSLVLQPAPDSQMYQTFQPLAGQSANVTTMPGIKVVE